MKCKECIHYKLCRDLFCQVDTLTDDDKKCDYFEQKRPHGEWEDGTQGYSCSECYYIDHFYFEHNFCPHCGADMREGDPDDRA